MCQPLPPHVPPKGSFLPSKDHGGGLPLLKETLEAGRHTHPSLQPPHWEGRQPPVCGERAPSQDNRRPQASRARLHLEAPEPGPSRSAAGLGAESLGNCSPVSPGGGRRHTRTSRSGQLSPLGPSVARTASAAAPPPGVPRPTDPAGHKVSRGRRTASTPKKILRDLLSSQTLGRSLTKPFWPPPGT